jgi:peptide/nickel transport system permease protein
MSIFRHDEKIFVTSDLTSLSIADGSGAAVLDTIPVTLSLVIGAAILWVIWNAHWHCCGGHAGSWLDKLFDPRLMEFPCRILVGQVMNLVTQSRFDTWMFSGAARL